MADGYQISDSLKELSLDGISGRKTDRIRFRMVSGTVAGFQAENITEVTGGGVSITGGGSSFLDKRQIEPVKGTVAPVKSTNRRKCTLWLKTADGEQQVQFESDEVALREGHIVHVACASTNGNNVYYLTLINESTGDAYDIGGFPMSAILGFGAEPRVGLLFYAGASLVVAFVLGISLFGLAGAGETAAFLIFFAFLGLRFFLWNRRQRVDKALTQRLYDIGAEAGKYMCASPIKDAGR